MADQSRNIDLGRREAQVSNLNFSPEKAGDERVERCDLSLAILLEEQEVDDLVRTRGNPVKVLWHTNGDPQIRDLKKLELDVKVVGRAELGLVTADAPIAFEAAVMKRVSIRPMSGRKAELKFQVRVDPTGHLEALGAMTIAERCVFSFKGQGAPESATEQGDLGV